MPEHQAGKIPLVRLAGFAAAFLPALLFPAVASAYLDLASAAVERLDNGLTVIVLEDPSFPVVSVQMLYRSGAKDEVAGKTGLAHFLEHMAFRDSENFPDTQVVSSIYATGGEWHGYTWLDQTTYYATAPETELDLLLRIEADRMARLKIPADDVLAERGAILSEMHGYENDPATVLHDYVLYLSFLAHPYRNNTIGWEGDIANITHADLVAFYRQHYQPGNAVLAIVGDVRRDDVMQHVRTHFAALQGQARPPGQYTAEPRQSGERRITLHGELDRKYFKIAYRAPAVSSPDLAAFLLTQELLSAGSGVNFLQNDWGTPARPGSALAGISEDLTTWFPPSEQDYVFVISGSIPAGDKPEDLETSVEAGIERLRVQFQPGSEDAVELLDHARERVFRELTFDVQTTEDAAHQLAYFAGLGALEQLIQIPEALERVSVEDIVGILDSYLASGQRTIGWYLPSTGETAGQPRAVSAHTPPVIPPKDQPTTQESSRERAGPATIRQLANGTPVIMRRSSLSRAAVFKVVVPAAAYTLPAGVGSGEPAWGLVSLDFELLPDEIRAAIAQARNILNSAGYRPRLQAADSTDPDSLYDHYQRDILGLRNPAVAKPVRPLLLVVTGDIEPDRVLQQLEAGFGDLPAGAWELPAALEPAPPLELEASVLYPIAQERIGYVVRIPEPRPQTAAAWQIALYILSHGYEGRLGKEAISRRGLVYYIDSAVETDGRNDWLTLSMGVDPAKLPAVRQLLKEELARLLTEPPSLQEIDEAKTHLLGRFISSSQSNRELADSLTRQWIWYGDVLDYEEWEQQLAAIRRQDVLDLLPRFTRGSVISIINPVSTE